MTSKLTADNIPETHVYLMVKRANDGRYQVTFVKSGHERRTSYTNEAGHVVQQAQRAGNIPVCTDDPELQRVCQAQQVALIENAALEPSVEHGAR